MIKSPNRSSSSTNPASSGTQNPPTTSEPSNASPSGTQNPPTTSEPADSGASEGKGVHDNPPQDKPRSLNPPRNGRHSAPASNNDPGRIISGITEKTGLSPNGRAAHAMIKGRNAIQNAASKTAQAAKKIWKKTVKAVKTIIHIITNPSFWITAVVIIVVTVVMMSTITAMDTYGSGSIACANSTDDSSSSSSSGTTSSDAGLWNDTAKAAAKEFQKRGFSKAATAAALGNFMQESAMVTSSTSTDGYGSQGLGQWTGGRLTNLKTYASTQGKEWTDAATQVDFAVDTELQVSGGEWNTHYESWIKSEFPDMDTITASTIMTTWVTSKSDDSSLKEGTFMFMAGYERPDQSLAYFNKRYSYAKSYITKLSTIGGTWATDGTIPDSLKSSSTSSGSSSTSSSTSSTDTNANCLQGTSTSSTGTTGKIGNLKVNNGIVDIDGIDTSKGDSYAWGQCTWWAAIRRAQIGKPVPGNLGNGGDWGDNAKASGYKVDQSPSPGDAVSFKPGTLGADQEYGHVAIVEEVHADGSILISEANARGVGVVSTRSITKAQLESVGMKVQFIH